MMNGSTSALLTPAKVRRTGKPSPSKPFGPVVIDFTRRSTASVGAATFGRVSVSAVTAGIRAPCCCVCNYSTQPARRSFPGETDAGERPAGVRREEVAVRPASVARRGGDAAAAQHVLVHHELAVVLADGAGGGHEPGIGDVGARR